MHYGNKNMRRSLFDLRSHLRRQAYSPAGACLPVCEFHRVDLSKPSQRHPPPTLPFSLNLPNSSAPLAFAWGAVLFVFFGFSPFLRSSSFCVLLFSSLSCVSNNKRHTYLSNTSPLLTYWQDLLTIYSFRLSPLSCLISTTRSYF